MAEETNAGDVCHPTYKLVWAPDIFKGRDYEIFGKGSITCATVYGSHEITQSLILFSTGNNLSTTLTDTVKKNRTEDPALVAYGTDVGLKDAFFTTTTKTTIPEMVKTACYDVLTKTKISVNRVDRGSEIVSRTPYAKPILWKTSAATGKMDNRHYIDESQWEKSQIKDYGGTTTTGTDKYGTFTVAIPIDSTKLTVLKNIGKEFKTNSDGSASADLDHYYDVEIAAKDVDAAGHQAIELALAQFDADEFSFGYELTTTTRPDGTDERDAAAAKVQKEIGETYLAGHVGEATSAQSALEAAYDSIKDAIKTTPTWTDEYSEQYSAKTALTSADTKLTRAASSSLPTNEQAEVLVALNDYMAKVKAYVEKILGYGDAVKSALSAGGSAVAAYNESWKERAKDYELVEAFISSGDDHTSYDAYREANSATDQAAGNIYSGVNKYRSYLSTIVDYIVTGTSSVEYFMSNFKSSTATLADNRSRDAAARLSTESERDGDRELVEGWENYASSVADNVDELVKWLDEKVEAANKLSQELYDTLIGKKPEPDEDGYYRTAQLVDGSEVTPGGKSTYYPEDLLQLRQESTPNGITDVAHRTILSINGSPNNIIFFSGLYDKAKAAYDEVNLYGLPVLSKLKTAFLTAADKVVRSLRATNATYQKGIKGKSTTSVAVDKWSSDGSSGDNGESTSSNDLTSFTCKEEYRHETTDVTTYSKGWDDKENKVVSYGSSNSTSEYEHTTTTEITGGSFRFFVGVTDDLPPMTSASSTTEYVWRYGHGETPVKPSDIIKPSIPLAYLVFDVTLTAFTHKTAASDHTFYDTSETDTPKYVDLGVTKSAVAENNVAEKHEYTATFKHLAYAFDRAERIDKWLSEKPTLNEKEKGTDTSP